MNSTNKITHEIPNEAFTEPLYEILIRETSIHVTPNEIYADQIRNSVHENINQIRNEIDVKPFDRILWRVFIPPSPHILLSLKIRQNITKHFKGDI